MNPNHERYRSGDITVFKIPGQSIPVVHRIIEAHSQPDDHITPRQKLLTKGDNNPVDDLQLYKGLEWLENQHIVGKVYG